MIDQTFTGIEQVGETPAPRYLVRILELELALKALCDAVIQAGHGDENWHYDPNCPICTAILTARLKLRNRL